MRPVKLSFSNFTLKSLNGIRGETAGMFQRTDHDKWNGWGSQYINSQNIFPTLKAELQQLTIATFAIDFNTGVAKELQSVLLY